MWVTEFKRTAGDRKSIAFSPWQFSFILFTFESVIALQYCLSFCSTTQWISYMCTYSSSPVVLVVKNPPANARDGRDVSSIPGLARSPRIGNGNPLQYSCWKIPWSLESGGLPPMGSQRGGHDWGTEHTHLLPLGCPTFPLNPSRSSQRIELSSLCYTAAFHQLSLLHMVVDVCICEPWPFRCSSWI